MLSLPNCVLRHRKTCHVFELYSILEIEKQMLEKFLISSIRLRISNKLKMAYSGHENVLQKFLISGNMTNYYPLKVCNICAEATLPMGSSQPVTEYHYWLGANPFL